MSDWSIFLGGHDLEMVEIKAMLSTCDGVVVHDRGLALGATAASYEAEIREALGRGRRVALVELTDDLPGDLPRDRITVVDHHDADAGADRPTAIEQVFALLGLPADRWTRDLALVAANDRGHIAAMTRIGATPEEIRDIRARDRRAQGITEAEEHEGREAARLAESLFDGRLTIVTLGHGRTAAVTDPLDPALGGPGYRNLLVLCPRETLFFGAGEGVETLRRRFPGGWCGGELPARGFWGIDDEIPRQSLLDALEDALHVRD